MRILLAGGVYRFDPIERAKRQPTPEIVLTEGLRNAGCHVDNLPLERVTSLVTRRSYDIVHVHHLSRAAVAAALSDTHRPFVFTAHSAVYPTSLREKLGLRVVSTRMAAGVCLSEAERQMRCEWFPESLARQWVIPNGMTLPDNPIARRAWDGGTMRALFVGQLANVKQVDLIIRALAEHPFLRVRLVYHNNELETQLRQLAVQLDVANRVDFVGIRSGNSLFDEYARAHVLLLPSQNEALPSVVTEALSTGLPIIATSVGGVPVQVGDAGVLMNTPNLDALNGSISLLLSSYDVYAGTAARRALIVREEYSVSAMTQHHMQMYQTVLS